MIYQLLYPPKEVPLDSLYEQIALHVGLSKEIAVLFLAVLQFK